MTDQSKIDKNNARPASLIERAGKAYGLENLGSPKVPGKLPPAKVRKIEPAAQPPVEATLAASPPVISGSPGQAPAPKEPAVTFAGSRVEIDRDQLRNAGLIVPEDPVSGLLEEFRIVKRDIIADARSDRGDKQRRILFCSPHPGEGKTYCAINLAIALAAERDVEVLLVDADVIRPSVAGRLGFDGGQGLMDVLSDESILPERLVRRTDIEGLFVLPAGSANSHDAEYLSSARTGEVLDRLTRGAPNRYVIFDTPPALAASPAAELAAHVGQAILVARAEETGRPALEDARQLLSACPNIKLLLNAARYSPTGRTFGDYGDRSI